MPAKHVLGLDLGTTSIGFAHIIEGETPEQSQIVQLGVRVNPLTTDEQSNFSKGKPITTNADRTLKRGARRNLDRYQLRRKHLLAALRKGGLLQEGTLLAEDGKGSTFQTWRLRAKAVTEKIEKEELVRVLLAINKKRGYKSSRKAKDEADGKAVDGMEIARRLYEENLTPGQLAYRLLQEGKKSVPDFYRSDLQAEFDRVWNTQSQYFPDIFTADFYRSLQGKGLRATSAAFWARYQFNTAENKSKNRHEKKLQAYQWRSTAVHSPLQREEAAYVIAEINNDLANASGYLGGISDRSKALFFNRETVGQHLYRQLLNNPHARLKNQVFYRQDYLNEFEAIWQEQAKYHRELTDALKAEIRDIVIFYQRKLKSQKGLISLCEFEQKEVTVNGKPQTIGYRVAPKSSPLFQELKIWQILNNVLIRKKGSRKRVPSTDTTDHAIYQLDLETKELLFEELNLKGNLPAAKVLELLGLKSSEWEIINYTELEGNRTNQALYNAYLKILELEGYDEDLLKLSNKDEIEVAELKTPAAEIKSMVSSIFSTLGIAPAILEFHAEAEGKAFEMQNAYQLWHMLYSYEGDDSRSGNEKLYTTLQNKFGFKRAHAQLLANVSLTDDYASLSTKAMRKIYPYIKELAYDKACAAAGYRHSAASLTREELAARPLKGHLDLLKKNSLRNPVVEKILNQMVNVVNALLEKNRKDNPDFRFDEIRIELARELKKNAKERAEMTAQINAAKGAHEKVIKVLQTEFGVKNPTRNDIIRYRLYEELKNNGYKDLYTNEYIPRDILFSSLVDIEHIIPQSRLFDDSFSNKTIVYRKTNLDKGNQLAYDYIENKYGSEKLEEYKDRIERLYQSGLKNKEEGISKAKYQKLLKRAADLGDGFIERDLRDSQYIAKKAKEMLFQITRSVVSTSGSITDRLREDWGLVNLMQELNFAKFKALGLTEQVEKKDGTFKERIVDWTKRNDHRHHAMDALTVAFTKRAHIQYLNHLNARYNEAHHEHSSIKGIEAKETHWKYDDSGNKKRVFNLPIPHFRAVAREHLESVLVSHKAKNKVVTNNKNCIKTKTGERISIERTPRGQLHKETVYGKYRYYVSKYEKVGAKFNAETIAKVANPTFRQLLLERLTANENDPKRAFTGKNALSKNPISVSSEENMPETVQLVWLEEDYSVRKEVTPENFKDEKTIAKILDPKIRSLMLERLALHGDDPKRAFSELDKHPIWFNQEKGITVKSVTISGVKNAEPLHYKKDHHGNEVLDERNKKIPVDFVSTGNNHHVALYRDEKGILQERVVSFFDAVQLVNAGLPVIDKHYNAQLGWRFLFSMKQNEYFIFPHEASGFLPENIDLLDPANKAVVSPHLYRVQKLATRDYMFRHHLETSVEAKAELRGSTFIHIWTPNLLLGVVKVRINHLGDIVQVGEY